MAAAASTTGTLATYWKRYKAISPWVAMYAYMVTFVLWGILFLPPSDERLVIAASVIPLGVILDHLLHKWQTGKPNWQSALITSCIVTVLMPTGVEWYIPPLAVALAIGSKHFLLYKKRHVFNPASVGVVLTALVFGYSLGWWPDSFLWLTVFFGILNVWRVRKFPQVITFLVLYTMLTYVANGSLPTGEFIYGNLGAQSVPLILPFFFALFMLPEPMTSMQPKGKQMEFGAAAAFAGFGLSYVDPLAPAALLWGLLVANAYAAMRR